VLGITYDGSVVLDDLIDDIGPRSKFSPLVEAKNNVNRTLIGFL